MAREVRYEDVVWIEWPDIGREEFVADHDRIHALEYWVEGAENDDEHVVLWTFDELLNWYEEWDQSEEEEPYASIYDYLVDALWEGIHAVYYVKGEEEE